MTTYVKFYDTRGFSPEKTVKQVTSRDFNALSIPSYAFGFYFFDQNETSVDGGTLVSDEFNKSSFIYIGGTVMDKQAVIDKSDTRADADRFLRTMDSFDCEHAIETKFGAWQLISSDAVVIDEHSRQVIWPRP